MTDPILTAGQSEDFKLVVHLGLFGLVCVAALYNVGAWLDRRDRRLAWNAAIYTGMVLHEWRQVVHHARARD